MKIIIRIRSDLWQKVMYKIYESIDFKPIKFGKNCGQFWIWSLEVKLLINDCHYIHSSCDFSWQNSCGYSTLLDIISPITISLLHSHVWAEDINRLVSLMHIHDVWTVYCELQYVAHSEALSYVYMICLLCHILGRRSFQIQGAGIRRCCKQLTSVYVYGFVSHSHNQLLIGPYGFRGYRFGWVAGQ